MGWLYMTKAGMGEHSTPKTYLDAQFTYERQAEGDKPFLGQRVLNSACVQNRTYYAAVETYNTDGSTREVTAVICLVRSNPRAADGMVFGYKDMSEHAGPCEAECPEAILELLTSTNDPYALDWRRRCHRTLRLRSRTLPDGALIRLPEPLTFTDGSAHSEFRVRREGRKIILSLKDGRGSFKISRLMDRAFTIAHEPKAHKTVFPTA